LKQKHLILDLSVAKQKRPSQIKNLQAEITACIDKQRYMQSRHAVQRQTERNIELVDALHVLRHGYHEKRKTFFDEVFSAWKYAIRGKALDGLDIRVVIAFDAHEMIIITVMQVED
jgi:Domain of unknown function (DUF4258)